jgi:hypothetical protein
LIDHKVEFEGISMAEEVTALVPYSVPPQLPQGRVLRSWREVARYMNRGVRTVQRWEKFLNLPVHRIESKGEVFAFTAEVDAWFQSFAKGATQLEVKDDDHWREVAEQASQEEDPAKLIQLIQELNQLLSQEKSTSGNRPRYPTPGHRNTAA